MAPSLLQLGAVALAIVGEVSAGKFYLDETYDYTNFFSKFTFFESRYDGSPEDIDPTHGFVQYRNKTDAINMGLAATQGTEIYLGVDHAKAYFEEGTGRSSVRLESNKLYTKGLFIARFTHLPQPVCGSWPAL
jgi:hypothetical protein